LVPPGSAHIFGKSAKAAEVAAQVAKHGVAGFELFDVAADTFDATRDITTNNLFWLGPPKLRANEPMAFGDPSEICPIPVVDRYGVNFYQDLIFLGAGLAISRIAK
jgi:hypothetical protein